MSRRARCECRASIEVCDAAASGRFRSRMERLRAAAARLLVPVLATGAAGVLVGSVASVASADSCPNAAFRVGASAGLPDCRAYEQITPANKQGSNDMFLDLGAGTETRGLAADDGTRVLLTTSASFGPSPDGLTANDYVFSRTASGWQLVPVQPAGAGDTHYSMEALGLGGFTPDLSLVAPLSEAGSSASESSTTPESLSFGAPGGPYTPIVTTTQGNPPAFVGASQNFSAIFFATTDHSLVPAAAGQVAGSDALYEWTDGQLQLVNVTTGGSLTSACGATIGAAGHFGGYGSAYNAVSSDGSKVFFISPDTQSGNSDPSCAQPPQLYVRENNATTVEVSAPNPGVSDPDGPQPVAFVGASADGSKVFFVTKTELTADDTSHDPELYEYETGSGTLTRVSRGVSGDADGNVQWAIVSDDGSAVYFAALGQLAAGAPALTPPSAGGTQVNLYYYDTDTGATRYITTVNGADGPRATVVPTNAFNGSFHAGSDDNWYVTLDGRFLLFASSADLTGYDPGTTCANEFGDEGDCTELYRYDSSAGSLTCVSCGGTSPAAGSAEFTHPVYTAPGWTDIRPPRPISNDGSRVFFDTPDALLPQDTNGRRDVYEWEADGSGSCESTAQNGGCLYLISSGTDPTDSLFVDSSANGNDVFFGTHAQLAPTDTDFDGDLYDARVDGGFPAPASAASCSGDACQGPLTPAPPPPTVATVTFAGPGDAQPARRTTVKVKPKVTVVTRAVHGTSFLVRVKVSGKGRITISNPSIKTVRRSVTKAGTYALRVAVTPKAKRKLQHKPLLKLKLRVRYAPMGARATAVSVTVTVKPAVRASRQGRKRRNGRRHRGGAK